jgi:hypothetical protein
MVGGMPQPGCTGTLTLIIEPSGRTREKKMKTMSAASRWSLAPLGAGDTPDGADLHQFLGPTPRTTGAMDHHTADLIDAIPCHTSAIDASIV